MYKLGTLRVWWIPQVPMDAFYVSVNNLREARLILNTLAFYDIFQFENNVKPDYCNAGGLEVFDEKDNTDGPEGSWVSWWYECGYTYYDDLKELSNEQIKILDEGGEL